MERFFGRQIKGFVYQNFLDQCIQSKYDGSASSRRRILIISSNIPQKYVEEFSLLKENWFHGWLAMPFMCKVDEHGNHLEPSPDLVKICYG